MDLMQHLNIWYKIVIIIYYLRYFLYFELFVTDSTPNFTLTEFRIHVMDHDPTYARNPR